MGNSLYYLTKALWAIAKQFSSLVNGETRLFLLPIASGGYEVVFTREPKKQQVKEGSEHVATNSNLAN